MSSAAMRINSRPTSVEPVNATLSTSEPDERLAHRWPRACEDVDHAIRDARSQIAPSSQRGERRQLRGLQTTRAARGQRGGQLPRRHQKREVPRHDLRRRRPPARAG